MHAQAGEGLGLSRRATSLQTAITRANTSKTVPHQPAWERHIHEAHEATPDEQSDLQPGRSHRVRMRCGQPGAAGGFVPGPRNVREGRSRGCGCCGRVLGFGFWVLGLNEGGPRTWWCGVLDLLRGVRRRPTLPHPPGCSTIGAVGLSFRVRDGTGRFPHAVTAVTLSPVPWRGRGWVVCGYNCHVRVWCCDSVFWFSSNGFVGWEPHSGRERILFLCTTLGGQTSFEGLVCPGGVWCKLSAY